MDFAPEYSEFGAAFTPPTPVGPQPEEILLGLNPAQRAAVLHADGPAMIIAGAGSGKTRVLTYRLAYLIATGKANPWQLLALTFTNKAAREMRERIQKVIGGDARNIAMGTFHSVFARILRIESGQIGFTSDFSIYDADDARTFVSRIIKELNYDDKKYKPRNVLHLISLAKNDLIGPDRFENLVDDEFKDVTHKVYKIYQNRLRQANAMDFDDLLFYTATLLKDSPEALLKYQHKWKYVMVDEYQDTNRAQYYITKKLTAVHENITVVGDDAQSIYSFRGANIQNILNFKKDYPDLALFKLEENYRSTNTIVQAANAIIANNVEQIQKDVFTSNPVGDKIKIIRAQNEQEEALRVVDTIREHKAVHSLHNRDFALLYRTNAQSRALEEALRRAGIPYKIFGGQSFYARKEIKDVLAYLKLAVNPNDEEAALRVINYPARGIGDKTIAGLQAAAQDRRLPLWDIIANVEFHALDYVGRLAPKVTEFANVVKSFQRHATQDTAAEAVAYVAKNSGILKDLHQENSTESLSRWENVQELINAAADFTERAIADGRNGTLGEFLQEVLLLTDTGAEEDNNFVSLMSIHSAKGLEYKSVFVTGLEEGLFPSSMSFADRASLEEERRLFYVALTRAEKLLSLSFAETRLRFGERNRCEPSRFLEEIPEEHLAAHAKRALAPSFSSNTSGKFFDDDFENPPRRPNTNAPGTRHPAGKTPAKGVQTGNTNKLIPNERGGIGPLPPRPQRPEPTRLTPLKAAERLNPSPVTPTDDLSGLQVGNRVEHNKFGIGSVVGLSDDRMVVDFPGRPKTTLLFKFARVRIVG